MGIAVFFARMEACHVHPFKQKALVLKQLIDVIELLVDSALWVAPLFRYRCALLSLTQRSPRHTRRMS